MSNIAERLDVALRLAGLQISGVSIGTKDNKATWTVRPTTLQAAAQPIIDAFDTMEPPPEKTLDERLGQLEQARYLGIRGTDPALPKDGDLWLLLDSGPVPSLRLRVRHQQRTVELLKKPL